MHNKPKLPLILIFSVTFSLLFSKDDEKFQTFALFMLAVQSWVSCNAGKKKSVLCMKVIILYFAEPKLCFVSHGVADCWCCWGQVAVGSVDRLWLQNAQSLWLEGNCSWRFAGVCVFSESVIARSTLSKMAVTSSLGYKLPPLLKFVKPNLRKIMHLKCTWNIEHSLYIKRWHQSAALPAMSHLALFT